MSRSKYNNDIYSMYEEECLKNKILKQEQKDLKLENSNLKYEMNYPGASPQSLIERLPLFESGVS